MKRPTRLIVGLSLLLFPVFVLAQAPPADPAPQREPADASPTLITLQLTNATPQAAFEQLGKLAGCKFDLSRYDVPVNISNALLALTSIRSVTIDAKEQPFWSVLLEICQQADAVLNIRRPGVIGISRRTNSYSNVNTDGLRHVSGAFLLLGTAVEHVVDFTRPPEEQKTFHIRLSMLAEPKITLLSVSALSLAEEAVDEKGTSLVMAAPDARSSSSYNSSGNNAILSAAIRLNIPPGAGRRVAVAKGNLTALVRTRVQRLEIDKPAGMQEKKMALEGMELTVRPLQLSGNESCWAFVELRRGTVSPEQWKQNQQFLRFIRVRIFDANGMEWNSSGGGSGWGGDQVSAQPHFQARFYDGSPNPPVAGRPEKMVVEIPLEGKEIKVPYEFKDLPRP